MNEEIKTPATGEKKKKTRLILIIAAVAVLAAGIAAWFLTSRYLASTARLIRYEGIVQLSGEDGAEKTIVKSMRFQSGSALRTESESLVAIGLDDTKVVTMNENSRTEFLKRGKKIQLHLTQGRLFFQVTKALKDDESFDIRTSTMVVGIRGTSGYVSVDEDGREWVYVTDGVVHVTGTNPVTGEVKEIDVYAGQRVTTYLFNERAVDSIVFFLEYPAEDQLPCLIPTMLHRDPELMEKVCAETGWSAERLEELAAGYIAQGSDRGVDVRPVGEEGMRPVESRVIFMAQSASKVYDGTPLTREGDVKAVGLPEGYTFRVTVEGSQTETGTSPNRITGWTILDGEGEDRTKYFLDVMPVDGQLTVIPMTLTITTPDAEKVYDGTPLTRKEYELRGVRSTSEEKLWLNTGYVLTEDGVKTVYVLDGSLHMVGANPLTREVLTGQIPAGSRVTVRLHSDLDEGSIEFYAEKISERELPEEILRLLAADQGLLDHACADAGWDPAMIEYLVKKLDGLVTEEDMPTPTPEPESLEPAKPAEEKPLAVPGEKEDSPLHDEKVQEHLVEENAAWMLMVETDVVKYRDRDLLDTEAVLTRPAGNPDTLPEVEVTGSQTDVGSSPNTFTVKWDEGEEKNYDIVGKPGTLTVTPLTVTVKTGSAERAYDGTPLTSDEVTLEGLDDQGVTVTATGSRTNAGKSVNTYTIDWGELNRANYTVEEDLGTLTVTPATATVTTGSAQKTYDGTPLVNDEANVIGILEPGAAVRATGSRTDAGTSTNYYSLDWGTADPDNYTLVENLGTLTVNRAPITVTTGGGSKPYDGAALTNTAATVAGAPAGVTVTATGSQTNAGATPNTYTLNWNGVNAANYAVTENLGTLTVTPLSFTVTTPGDNKTYDGTPLMAVSTPATLTGSVPPGATVTATGSRTDAGTSPNTYTINWAGNNPANYTITENLGSLTVTPRTAWVSTGSATGMDYRYTQPDRPTDVVTNSDADIDGLALADEGRVTITATGVQSVLGSSPNTYVINWNGVNPANYTIVEYLGTLTVILAH